MTYFTSRFAFPRRGKQGIEGTHVTYHEDYSPEDDDALQGVRFAVSKRLGTPHPRVAHRETSQLFLEPSLRDLVERVLPLATYYTAISSFIEFRSHLDFGRVNHALCAALRDMLKVRQPASLGFSLVSCDNMATGLSDSSLSTRTCLQHIPTVHSPETLVLCPPHSPHPFTHLSTNHGARCDRESRSRQLIIVWRRC